MTQTDKLIKVADAHAALQAHLRARIGLLSIRQMSAMEVILHAAQRREFVIPEGDAPAINELLDKVLS